MRFMKYTTNICNIKDYGIVSDRKTDMTQAINHVIQTLSPHSSVRFPKGDYLISQALNFSNKSNMSIIFDNKAVLIPENNKFDAILIKGNPPKKWFAIFKYDALQGSHFICTTEHIQNCDVGTYIGIKSNKLLAGLNARKTYQYEYRKVTKMTTGLVNIYYFDIPLQYDFLISDKAYIGIANICENMTIINPQINTEPATENELLGRGIIASHVNHLDIQNPAISYSKPIGKSSIGYGGRSAIILNACINSTVTDVTIKHIGWYGVAVMGACYHVIIKKGICQDTRHAIDASVWINNLYAHQGEPNNITIEDIESVKSTESGFSTHDTGSKIKFIRCIAKESGTTTPSYGFIFRNPHIQASYCTASHSTLDGFNIKEGAYNAKIDYPTAFGNRRDGIQSIHASCNIFDANVFGNKKAGINISNGIIIGGSSLDNTFAFRVYWQKNQILKLKHVHASASEKQKICFLIDNNPNENVTNYIDLKECYFKNYNQNLFYIPKHKKLQRVK